MSILETILENLEEPHTRGLIGFLNKSAFADLLLEIVESDTDYDRRYHLVLEAVGKAHRVGLVAGVRIDPAEPEWPVAFIELPQGQVSWHLQQHKEPWDGHTDEEKFARIRKYAEPYKAKEDDHG